MITLTAQQLDGWLAELFWPFVRIGSCFMLAPAFGAVTVPMRVRVILAGAVALLVAPLVTVPDVTPLSAAGVLITIQQVIIGAALGFSLQILFEAVSLGGELVAKREQQGPGTPVLQDLGGITADEIAQYVRGAAGQVGHQRALARPRRPGD